MPTLNKMPPTSSIAKIEPNQFAIMFSVVNFLKGMGIRPMIIALGKQLVGASRAVGLPMPFVQCTIWVAAASRLLNFVLEPSSPRRIGDAADWIATFEDFEMYYAPMRLRGRHA
jgi:hypothetical protein